MFIQLSYRCLKYLFLVPFFIFFSCNDDEQSGPTPPTENVELDNEVNEFVWKALNSWYYWLDDPDIPNFSDSQDDNTNDFYTYLNGFSTPEALFNSITDIEAVRLQKTVNGQVVQRKFSYITDDYDELGGGFKAVYNSFGYDFILYRISDDGYIGQVRFVFPDSDAETAGLERGDVFTKVDGQDLTTSNLDALLFEDDSYTLSMATIEREGTAYNITPTGEEIEVTETERERSAIWVKKILDLDGDKTGYLLYSNFENSLNEELNDAFGEFKDEGVTDLILDLRYNPGGSVLTAIYLNSMIHSTDNSKLMGSIKYNRKHSSSEGNIFFSDTARYFDDEFNETGQAPINSLGLDRLFVITSSGTASASEFVINTLRPYIPVTIIGETTVGKNVGSIALYDNPPGYDEKEGANANHKYGMQPIVSKLSNSEGFTDYESGFAPDIPISETSFLDDLRPLGDPDEQLLNEAIRQICFICANSNITYEPVYGVEKVFETSQFSRSYQTADITGIARD